MANVYHFNIVYIIIFISSAYRRTVKQLMNRDDGDVVK